MFACYACQVTKKRFTAEQLRAHVAAKHSPEDARSSPAPGVNFALQIAVEALAHENFVSNIQDAMTVKNDGTIEIHIEDIGTRSVPFGGNKVPVSEATETYCRRFARVDKTGLPAIFDDDMMGLLDAGLTCWEKSAVVATLCNLLLASGQP